MIGPSWRALAIASIATLGTACASGQEPGSTPESEREGARLFARYCASCHGPIAEGDGPVAQVMEVGVPNLRTLRARSGGEFPREIVIRYIDGRDLPAAHGSRLMPVWGNTFGGSDAGRPVADNGALSQIEAIVAFLETLQN